ncbi:unnamed protein product [Rhizophagus irregularis]|nr:unnamed protein product [Rhizophagus irregularis]
MEGEIFSGKLKDSAQFEVQFSKATHYKPGKKYVIEMDTAYQEYQPYALFELHENCQGFNVVKFHTSGVNRKE